MPQPSMVMRQEMCFVGRVRSHKKVNPPNSTKCTHLSTRGASTFGMCLAGIRQPIKMSKVHSIAGNLAHF